MTNLPTTLSSLPQHVTSIGRTFGRSGVVVVAIRAVPVLAKPSPAQILGGRRVLNNNNLQLALLFIADKLLTLSFTRASVSLRVFALYSSKPPLNLVAFPPPTT